jgi:hypothetical protein
VVRRVEISLQLAELRLNFCWQRWGGVGPGNAGPRLSASRRAQAESERE